MLQNIYMIKLGFTGSRHGMSDSQEEQFALLVAEIQPSEFHHGDCIGADAQAHDIVRLFCPETFIVVHPPESDYLRAYKNGDKILPCLPYLNRDRKIVESVDCLLATPYTNTYLKHSGTWFTITYAELKEKPYTVFKR